MRPILTSKPIPKQNSFSNSVAEFQGASLNPIQKLLLSNLNRKAKKLAVHTGQETQQLNEKLAGLCSQIQEIISLNNVRASNDKPSSANTDQSPDVLLNMQSTIDATFEEDSPQQKVTKNNGPSLQYDLRQNTGIMGQDMLVEKICSELVPQWKHECLISLEHMRQMYLRSSDLAKQLIACSQSRHGAEQILELYVQRVIGDFQSVFESIKEAARSNSPRESECDKEHISAKSVEVLDKSRNSPIQPTTVQINTLDVESQMSGLAADSSASKPVQMDEVQQPLVLQLQDQNESIEMQGCDDEAKDASFESNPENSRKREVKKDDKSSSKKVIVKKRWTEEEHELFLEAARKYGKKYKLIAEFVGTKNYTQVLRHANFVYKQITEDPKMPGADLAAVLEPRWAQGVLSQRDDEASIKAMAKNEEMLTQEQEAPNETQVEVKEEKSLVELVQHENSPVVKINCNVQDNFAPTNVMTELTPLTGAMTPFTDSKKVVAREQVEFATPAGSGVKRAIIFQKLSPQQDGVILDISNRSSEPQLPGLAEKPKSNEHTTGETPMEEPLWWRYLQSAVRQTNTEQQQQQQQQQQQNDTVSKE